MSGYRRRSFSDSFLVTDAVESWSNDDGGVCDAAPCCEETAAGSQHGELRLQSTQDIGVAQSVEGSLTEGETFRGTDDRSESPDPFFVGSDRGRAQSFDRQVGDDYFTPGLLGQVKPRPALSRSNVEQPLCSVQSQTSGEFIGLGERRVTVCAPIPTDDRSFDLRDDVVVADCIALGELDPGLTLVLARSFSHGSRMTPERLAA